MRESSQPVMMAGVQPGPSKKFTRWLIAFLAVSGLGFFAGSAWSYLDEHSGRSAEATVTKCEPDKGHRRSTTAYCVGRWTVDGRTRTGDVYNAKPGDVGKTLAVRLHGDHASRPRLWVTLGLAVMGAFVLGVAVMLAVSGLKPRGAGAQG